MTHYLTPGLVDYQRTGQVPSRRGNSDPDMAPHGVYPAAGVDNWCAIACENDDQWRSLCREMRREDLAELTVSERHEQSVALDNDIGEWTKNQSAGGLQIRLQRHGIAAHMVQDTSDCMNDPQLVHPRHFPWAPHPQPRQVMIDGIPYHLSRSVGGFNWEGPTYVYHSIDVIEDILGYDGDQIAELAVAEVLE